MKSTRLRLIANLLIFLGVVPCLLGGFIYCLFCMPSVLNLPFDWKYLAFVLATAFLLLLVAMPVYGAMAKEKRLEKECERERMEAIYIQQTAELEQRMREEAAATKRELQQELASVRKQADKATAEARKANGPVNKLLKDQRFQTAKKVSKIALPTAIACVTLLALAASGKRHKKQAFGKQTKSLQAQNRQAFYQWLG